MERPAEPLVQRLLVCRYSRSISPELIDEVLDLLRTSLPAAARVASRNALVRAAAALLEGLPWQRAQTIADLIGRFRHPADEVRRLLWLAERNAPLPASARQIYRIISND
ncbi:MAG: hypothetical protein P9E88_18060 [Candidatus Competibacter sp.]|nr:hypothetical protein [Candidatus Competibacter sp.]